MIEKSREDLRARRGVSPAGFGFPHSGKRFAGLNFVLASGGTFYLWDARRAAFGFKFRNPAR